MRTEEGLVRDVLRPVVWFPLRWMTRLLPVGTSLRVFRLMGLLHYWAAGERRDRLTARLRDHLGEIEDASAVAREYYINHYIDRLHVFLYPKWTTPAALNQWVRFENVDALQREKDKGKGVLLVQPHFGPVQMTLLALAVRGDEPLQIGYPTDQGLSRMGRSVAFRYRRKCEDMLPCEIVSADKYLGKVYRHLNAGGIVLTTGDGAGGGVFLGEHREMTFLGGKRMIPLGPAKWAIQTGASLLPTFLLPEGRSHFKIVFEPPIAPREEGSREDTMHMMEQFAAMTERYIETYPYLWHFWDEI